KSTNTEVEVDYRWCPWFGLKVTTSRSCMRQAVACLQATLEHDGRLQLLEMPGWMFDRATCAAMPLADHPTVGIKHLRALRDLLTSAAGRREENLVEKQQLAWFRKEDADEEKEKKKPHGTQSVSVTSDHADLAVTAPRSATESLAPARAIVSRGSRRSLPLPRKGGRR